MAKRKRISLISLLLLLTCTYQPVAAANLDTVLVLHTNDLHGRISGDGEKFADAARIGAYFRQLRAQRNDVLVLDAGDCISGTPVSVIFRGVPIFAVMSAMGYDAVTLGNHEFDHGWEQIRSFAAAAAFPLLAANVYSPSGELIGDGPFVMLDIDGVRVGIIGVLTAKTPEITTRKGNEGIRFEPALDALRELVPRVEPQCDLLIVLSHLEPQRDVEIAAAIPGIDLIVGGHVHRLLEEPLTVNNTTIVRAAAYGTFVGRVEVVLDKDAGKVVSIDRHVVPARDLPPPDSSIQRQVDEWEAKVSAKVDVSIGSAAEDWDVAQVKTWVTAVMKERARADFGFYNDGGIRAGIPRGEVTARQIWLVLPFGNTLVKATVKGSEIGGALAGEFRKSGAQVDPGREYVIATNSFVVERPDAFLGKVQKIEDTHEVIRDIAIEYIERNGLRYPH